MFDPVHAVGIVATFDPADAPETSRRDALKNAQRLRSWLDSVEARWLAHWQTERAGRASTPAALSAELRSATGMSTREARRRTTTAAGSTTFPEAAAALAEGDITHEHLNAFTNAAANNPGAANALAAAQSELLTHARHEPADEFAKRVERQARNADASDSAEQRARRLHQRRNVRSFDDDTGMGIIRAELPPESKEEFWQALCHIARQLWRQNNGHPEPPRALNGQTSGVSTPNATVVVLIDITSLTHGLHAGSIAQRLDGEPVPISTIRHLACEAGIIPAVLATGGAVLDLGHRARYASPAQRLALGVMWRTCAYPGCNVAAAYTHAHHIQPVDDNGPTDLVNLVPLCTAHHDLVHGGGVHVQQPQSGHVIFTTPSGVIHHVYATTMTTTDTGTDAPGADRPAGGRKTTHPTVDEHSPSDNPATSRKRSQPPSADTQRCHEQPPKVRPAHSQPPGGPSPPERRTAA